MLLEDELGCDVRHGKPFKPSTQGCVERFNRTLEEMLCKSGMANGEVDQNWIDRIDLTVFRYNARLSGPIGRSPFAVMFGRQPFLDAAAAAGQGTEVVVGDEATQMEAVDRKIEAFFEARNKIQRMARLRETRYKARTLARVHRLNKTKRRTFSLGDEVLEKVHGDGNPATKRAKLTPRFAVAGTVDKPRPGLPDTQIPVKAKGTGKRTTVSLAFAKNAGPSATPRADSRPPEKGRINFCLPWRHRGHFCLPEQASSVIEAASP